ncbi:MAG: SRPBCC family protein [Myxococcota bacterium]|nr:SRPBCC family protein [Myxococcota bacterium]
MTIEPNGNEYILHQEQFIAQPLSEVWAFFSNAENLERLTPDFLNFKILTPTPIDMFEGTLIDYRIRLFGVPMNWRTEIIHLEPEVRFVDQQLKGPYAKWYHEHRFEEVDGGTLMTDRVEYRVPFSALGHLAHSVMVKRTLQRIFQYRYDAVSEVFGEPSEQAA